MRLLGRQSTETGPSLTDGAAPVDGPRDDLERLVQANGQLATLLTGLLESAHAEIAIVDEHSHFVAANGAFREQFLHGGDPTGMSLSELAGRLDDPPLLDMLDVVRQVLGSGSEVSLFTRDHLHGRDRWLDVTVSPLVLQPGVVLRASDVTDLVETARSVHAGRATDELTGLLSAEALIEALDTSLRRRASMWCVAMIDIDQFTVIRQTLGYSAGDELLRMVAGTLRRLAPLGSHVSRWQGDTFCVAFEPVPGAEVDHVASLLRDGVRQPVTVQGRTVRITASVGSTLCSADRPIEDALQQAELAMQEASKRGGNRCVTYDAELAEPQEGMVRLWNALRSALQFRQMEVWFQPVVSLATDKPIAAEALCRWHHPQFGDVSPGEFIPIAERNSEILNIGSFVHGRAAETAVALRTTRVVPMADFQISVNASPNELAWPDFARNMLARIKANDAHPEWFALELTEQALAQRDPAVRENIRILREAGVTLVLDDFGTGYSSLERLRDIPVDKVKIDRRFVANLDDERNVRIIATIVALAQELGMQTVAEGVETTEQAARLRSLGCNAAQGFLYAPAVPDSELTAVLRDISAVASTPRSRGVAPGA
ncbi:MAG: putative bifunctional diguanylate cyclase/phosphodiesterase [Ilumatobacteraceae bacterium]